MQNLNLDFSEPLAINTEKRSWIGSLASGVKRIRLARTEQESGHATSIVWYQAGAKFKRHLHPLGEEILVLSGVFSDENGDYGPGSNIRNPLVTCHAPFSQQV
jgi:anti-sigma factor ChrR (cupin superfamily)